VNDWIVGLLRWRGSSRVDDLIAPCDAAYRIAFDLGRIRCDGRKGTGHFEQCYLGGAERTIGSTGRGKDRDVTELPRRLVRRIYT